MHASESICVQVHAFACPRMYVHTYARIRTHIQVHACICMHFYIRADRIDRSRSNRFRWNRLSEVYQVPNAIPLPLAWSPTHGFGIITPCSLAHPPPLPPLRFGNYTACHELVSHELSEISRTFSETHNHGRGAALPRPPSAFLELPHKPQPPRETPDSNTSFSHIRIRFPGSVPPPNIVSPQGLRIHREQMEN